MKTNQDNKSISFSLVSIMPGMFDAITNYGVIGRAVNNGIINLSLWNPRDYTTDKNSTVDDRPYGGGPGMVMKAEPVRKAIADAKSAAKGKSKVIMLTPQGELLTQKIVEDLATNDHLVLVSGRYEGIDHRIQADIDASISIGDYILSGGELPSMVVIDSVSRLITGTLGDESSAVYESFSSGLLDYPHYTRPENFCGDKVPEVLLSGDHQKIARWRAQQSLGLTWLLRPDLLEKIELSTEDQLLLEGFISNYQKTQNCN